MNNLSSFAGVLTQADPLVLITVVSVVAFLVIAECVRHLCAALKNREDK